MKRKKRVSLDEFAEMLRSISGDTLEDVVRVVMAELSDRKMTHACAIDGIRKYQVFAYGMPQAVLGLWETARMEIHDTIKQQKAGANGIGRCLTHN